MNNVKRTSTNFKYFIHQDLKVKLRRLRAKLRKLKAAYQYSEDEEQSEKSEMDTLQDLKRATEQAIRELQVEAAKANKRKGENKRKKGKREDQVSRRPQSVGVPTWDSYVSTSFRGSYLFFFRESTFSR